MASSSTLLPGATVYAAREWDFNFQFPISRFSNYFDLWLLFQSQSQSQSHLRTGGVNVVVMCWCTDFLALLSGFAVHELAARYVFSLVSLFDQISATFLIKFNFM